MRATHRFLRLLTTSLLLLVIGATAQAQPPQVTIRYEAGGIIPQNAQFTSPNQVIVFQICSPHEITSLLANHVWPSGSTNLFLQDGPYDSCSNGGAAWLAEVTLQIGSNTFEVDATDQYGGNTYTSVTVQYVPPSRTSVRSPAPGGLRVPPNVVQTLPFTITNTGSGTYSFTVSVGCTGPFTQCKHVATGNTSFSTGSLAPGMSEVHNFTFTAGVTAGSGSIGVTTSADTPGAASVGLVIDRPAMVAPVATRARDTVFVAPSVSRSALFTVQNPDAFASRAITLSVNNCGTNTGCSVSPSSVTLGPGRDTTVTISFTTPATNQTTSVILSAAATSPTQADLETAWVKVGTAGTPTVTVNVADFNPGTSVAREQCLSIAAGAAAGVECGALRVAHGLPAVRTMGVARAPTLLLLSDNAHSRVRLAAKVSVANLITGDSIHAALAVFGGLNLSRSWAWEPQCASASGCIIQFPIETASYLPTGAYSYTLEIKIGRTSPPTGSAAGAFVVNDTRGSYFGNGWWLEGHERLMSVFADTTGKKLWIGGDGSARVYIKRNATTWTVEDKVTRADTIVWSASDSLFRRQLRNGGYVGFDVLGRHRRTVNRQGHVTEFVYQTATADRIATILLPKPAGSAAQPGFRFDYTSDSLRVTRMRAWGADAAKVDTTLFVNDGYGRLERVIGMARDTVTFLYGTPTYAGVLTGRVNRLNDTTLYAYNAGGGVDSVVVKMRTAPAIVTKFCPAETRSLAACGTDPARPVPMVQYFTRLDGPRTDLPDVTQFFVNRFGAPDSVVDANGGRTRVKRQNANYPALITETVDVAGLVSQSFYNSRGLPDSTRVMDPLGTGSNAVSKFKWDPKWDMATSVRTPTNEVDSIAIDATTGSRLWQRRQADSTKVRFTYDTHNRVDSVITQAIGLVGRMEYESTLGNVWKSRSAMGFLTEALQDGRGVDTLVWTPTDSAQTSGLRTKQIVRYDVAGRPVRTETHSPAIPWTLYSMAPDSGTTTAAIQVVVTEYDKEGQPFGVRRFAASDSSAGTTAKSITGYDAAGRVTSKTEWHVGGSESFTYDPAGNLISTTTKRGHVITRTYDALNRIVAQAVPEVRYGRTFCSQCHSWTQFIVGNDSVFTPDYGTEVAPEKWDKAQVFPAALTVYGYDQAGRMVQADNPDVLIRRGYFPNGALKADSTWMRAYEMSDAIQWPTENRSILTYTYDLSGRRLTRGDQRGGQQTYSYDALGQLSGTTDRATSGGSTVSATFGYDALGRLKSQSIPAASATASWTYDVEGRVTARAEEGFSDTFRYDARGKRIVVTGRLLMTGSSGGFIGAYDGLGQLVASSTDDRPVPTSERISVDAHGNVKARWSNRGAWGGNNESLDSASFLGHVLNTRTGTHAPAGRTGPGGYGPALLEVDSLALTYDNAGNVEYQTNIRRRWIDSYPVPGTIRAKSGHSWNWSFYDATDRLRAAQKSAPSDTLGKISTIFEEYWYDALGRRVLVRTRVDSMTACPASEVVDPVRCQQQVLRTTWDGDQVLFEQRDPAGWQYIKVMSAGGRVPMYGASNWYGHVRYTQTGAIDNPLLVWKDDINPRTLHRNWRGNVAGATFASGAAAGTADTVTVWPAAISDVWKAPDDAQSLPVPNAWLGSVVSDGKDGTGTLYRRNRYYDPTSGRFTQQDPTGLAGGLNLYGYGAGDPINNSDPFGLCPVPADNCPPGTFTALGAGFGALLGGVGGGGTGFLAGPGAVVAVPVLSVAGAAKGAALGGAIGATLDGLVMLSKGESAVIGQAISEVMGAAANTAENRRCVGDYLEECKAAGDTGTKNSRGDFNWQEMLAKVREYFNKPEP